MNYIIKILAILSLCLIIGLYIYRKTRSTEYYTNFTHYRTDQRQSQENAIVVDNIINNGAHIDTTITGTDQYEISYSKGKSVYDKYSKKYADCQNASINNLPNGCIACIDKTTGNPLSITINGPGIHQNNYFTKPCDCPISDPTTINKIRKAFICEKINTPFGITGTDCAYSIGGSTGFPGGHGILLEDNKPYLEKINEQLPDTCQLTYKPILDINKLISPNKDHTFNTIADELRNICGDNRCGYIDNCNQELDENINNRGMSQDCAKQIYNKYGEPEGLANPDTYSTYMEIMNTYSGNNVHIQYENEMKRLANELNTN